MAVMTKSETEQKILEALRERRQRGLLAYLVPHFDEVQFTEVDRGAYDSSFAAEVGGEFSHIALAVGRLQERGEIIVDGEEEFAVPTVSLPYL
jgi:hypothetical protein